MTDCQHFLAVVIKYILVCVFVCCFYFPECFLTLLFACNAIVDLANYIVSTISSTVVELSTRQKKLLAVSNSGQLMNTNYSLNNIILL